MPPIDDPYAELVAAQFGAAIRTQETALANHAEKDALLHKAADKDIADLEKAKEDHETRLRSVEQATTQFRFLVTLSAGGGLLSVIMLIRDLIK